VDFAKLLWYVLAYVYADNRASLRGRVVVLVPEMQEYCQWETFNATCFAPNEVVLITAARYGRMRVGRCLPVDYYVGCFADVLDHVELRCNGRPSCRISVPDAELFRVQPCRKDLVAYFEAAYRCVPGLTV